MIQAIPWLVISSFILMVGLVAAAPLGPPYQYPTNDSEANLIVGTFPYPRGPAVWNDTLASPQPYGGWGLSEGWTFNVAQPDPKTGLCPPIPDDVWGRGLDHDRLKVMRYEGGCFIGCNISDIAAGAPDPCNGGAISIETPRFGPVLANFSCFYGGPGFLNGQGQCGFNCTAFDIYNKTPCNIWEANDRKAQCNIECNPAKF